MRQKKQKRTYLLTLYRVCYGVGLLFLIGYLVSFMPVVRAVTSPGGVLGWSWNAFRPKNATTLKLGLGWSSLNCLNDFDNDGELENQCNSSKPYGLTVDVGADNALGGTGANADYLKGCAWSSAYGWVCFNGGTGSTYQCDESQFANPDACQDLTTSGVAIKSQYGHCSSTWTSCLVAGNCEVQVPAQTCIPNFYYLDSPTYSSGAFTGPPSNQQRANILSTWTTLNSSYQSYVTFPYGDNASTTGNLNQNEDKLFGCFGCTTISGTSGKCGACLSVATEDEDPATNPNPNLLAWNCSDCTVTDPDGGSCSQNRDKNSCKASSCAGRSSYTGVVVNEYPKNSGQYEMCGWGWNAYDDPGATIKNIYSPIDSSDLDDGKYNDLTVDSNGLPVVSYHSCKDLTDNNCTNNTPLTDTRVLSIARCGDPSCTMKRVVDIDSASGNVSEGPRTQILTTNTNLPMIAYTMGTELRYAYCLDPDCYDFQKKTLVSGASYNRISMVKDVNGLPVISLYEFGIAQVTVYKCGDTACSSGGRNFINSAGDGGIDNAVAVPSDNRPLVVYSTHTGSNSLINFVRCNNDTCSTGTTGTTLKTIVGTAGNDPPVRIRMGTDDVAVILYYNAGDKNLYLIKCNNNNLCSGGVETKVADNIVPGDSMSLVIGSDNFPVISYITASKLHLIRCSNVTCSTKTDTIVSAPGTPGVASSVALTIDQNPLIVYYSSAASDLHAFKCSTRTCDPLTRKGFGWLAFNPQRIGDTTYVHGEGNIFSGGNIYSPIGPPVNKYNSTYIIEASGQISNWFSEKQYSFSPRGITSPYLKAGTGQPQVYQSSLGKLDYQGIVTDVVTGVEVSASNTSGTNKYGRAIKYFNIDSDLFGAALNNSVLYSPSSKTIKGGDLKCGSGTVSGAGIVVINGNLTIDKGVGDPDITYAGCSPSKLSHISSVVWIVRGDVIIDPDVQYIAGTFIVLGDGDPSRCPELSSTAASGGCGRFSTGVSNPPFPFTSQGAVLARQFNFQRTRAAGSGPAETFIADGRLQANTPAGLSDLAKSLPRFSGGF